jgi:predicted metalloprotease with PDZ domain
MTKYTLNTDNSHTHFLQIEASFNCEGKSTMILKLPAWRPGRYELGNFAKNIKDLEMFNEKGEKVHFAKRKKDEWFVEVNNSNKLVVKYLYYSNVLNAGSTFLDEHQLYVNPVNCFIYEEFQENATCELKLNIPKDYKVAITLPEIEKNTFKATTFHEMVDSPFIASNSLKYESYTSNDVVFNIYFQGVVKPNWEKIVEDFKKFTDYQFQKMGGFPFDQYNFYFQINTNSAYHGVEHLKSTVIQLGPSYDVFGKLYTELLGVSSHELYHAWNVKTIRPVEMFPYDYSEENYTRLGYVTEGVTTYMGDRTLYESGVFDEKQYQKELVNYITRHFHNDGRKHYSVADASFDTWLDGYEQGIPGRKTSIYVEGCLIAYICDMRIRKETQNQKSLHDVMKKLYELSQANVGYSDEIYKEVLELVGECSFDDVFEKLVFGKEDYTPFLENALAFENWKLVQKPSPNFEHHLGIKGTNTPLGFEIKQVLEASAAYQSGLVEGDVVSTVNGIAIKNDFHNWLTYFEGESIILTVFRNQQKKEITLTTINSNQFYQYFIEN